MKKTLTLIASLLLTVAAEAQTVNIHMTDGTVINYPSANVSYIDFTVKNDPEPSTAPEGVVAVDLGLPSGTKWANMNVGATKPEEFGLYFAWGETTGYTSDITDGRSFNWESYKWCNGSQDSMTKYCTKRSYGTEDKKTTLELADDAVHVNWGGSWVMPTIEEIEELIANTTSEWTTVNDVKGRKFTSKTNGNSVFLPAAGYRYDTNTYHQGTNGYYYGYYWSASLNKSYPYAARYLYFGSGEQNSSYLSRDRGIQVRPVLRK